MNSYVFYSNKQASSFIPKLKEYEKMHRLQFYCVDLNIVTITMDKLRGLEHRLSLFFFGKTTHTKAINAALPFDLTIHCRIALIDSLLRIILISMLMIQSRNHFLLRGLHLRVISDS